MKFLKVIGKIFAIIFCIAYFFILTGIMTLILTKNLISGNYYANILEDTDLKQIKIADIGDVFDETDLDEDASLQDAIVLYFTEGGVEEEKAVALIENKEIRSIVGNFIGEYINYTLGGEKPKILRDDVERVLTNPDFVNIAGETSEEDIDEIYNQLNDMVEELIEGGSNDGNTERNNEVN